MLSSMQPGKRYRLCTEKDWGFVDGYFFNGCFYDDRSRLIGDLGTDGSFRYCAENRVSNVLRYFYALIGRVEGLRLVRLDGTGFDLVEVLA